MPCRGSYHMSSIEQLLYRHMDRTSSSTGSPCLSLALAVLGLMERMLPSQRRTQEKSLQLYLLLWCDVWVVNKEAITGSGQKEEWKDLMQSSFHIGTVARWHDGTLLFNILYLSMYTFVLSHFYSSVGENLSGLTSRDLNSGLPNSKPTHYKLSYAAPTPVNEWKVATSLYLYKSILIQMID
jgi:hypothetical protein